MSNQDDMIIIDGVRYRREDAPAQPAVEPGEVEDKSAKTVADKARKLRG